MTTGYTPTEQRILDVLSDGEAHRADELFACLCDDCGGDRENLRKNLAVILFNLRRKMKPTGRTILSEWNNRRAFYRHVRLLHPVSSE